MARGNGVMTGTLPYHRAANQDRMHFELGASTARPSTEYFAIVAGLLSEQQIVDAIAGLTGQELKNTLVKLLGRRQMARDYIKWRMRGRR